MPKMRPIRWFIVLAVLYSSLAVSSPSPSVGNGRNGRAKAGMAKRQEWTPAGSSAMKLSEDDNVDMDDMLDPRNLGATNYEEHGGDHSAGGDVIIEDGPTTAEVRTHPDPWETPPLATSATWATPTTAAGLKVLALRYAHSGLIPDRSTSSEEGGPPRTHSRSYLKRLTAGDRGVLDDQNRHLPPMKEEDIEGWFKENEKYWTHPATIIYKLRDGRRVAMFTKKKPEKDFRMKRRKNESVGRTVDKAMIHVG